MSDHRHADERRFSRTAKSCGPDAPTLASSSRSCVGPTGLRQNISADDGGKRARSPGRARHKPLKPLRAGMPGVPVYSLLLVCVLPIQVHTRPRVQRAPGIPHALKGGREIHAELGRIVSRGREVVSEIGVLKIKSGICIGRGALPLPLWERVGVRGRGLSMGRNPSPGSHLRCDPTSPTGGRGDAEHLVPVIAGSGNEPIHAFLAARWIASRSLASGAPSRDAVVRNDGKHGRRRVTLRYPAGPASHTQDIDVPSRSRHGNGLGFYPTG